MNHPNKILKADPEILFNITFDLKKEDIFFFGDLRYKIVSLIDRYKNEDTFESHIEFVTRSEDYPCLFCRFSIYRGVYNDGFKYFYDEETPYLVEGKLITVWKKLNG